MVARAAPAVLGGRRAWLAVAGLLLGMGCGAETSDYVEPIWLPTGGTGGNGAGSTATTATGSGAAGLGGHGADGGSGGNGGNGGWGGGCDVDDPREPNESEVGANDLTVLPIDDCDGSGGEISAALTSPADVDWFHYRGNDTPTCSVTPTVVLVGGSGLRICQFVDCLSTDTTVSNCPSGTMSAVSLDGRAGCCGSAGFGMDFNCEGSLDEDAHVYIRVDAPNAAPDICNSYVMGYHY